MEKEHYRNLVFLVVILVIGVIAVSTMVLYSGGILTPEGQLKKGIYIGRSSGSGGGGSLPGCSIYCPGDGSHCSITCPTGYMPSCYCSSGEETKDGRWVRTKAECNCYKL
jgi:hypothetical protein